MNHLDDEELEEALAKVKKLARRPRDLLIVCVTDGSQRTIKDDGGSWRDKEGFVPNGRRMAALNILDKKDRKGQRMFFAGVRHVSDDGEVSYEPKAIEAAFDGDPLASWPVLDAAAIELIAKNCKARDENTKKSDETSARDMLDVMVNVAKRAKQESPRVMKPKKEAVANVES